MWAVFQWGELLVSRSGGETFCTIDSTFDCRAVWDSGFASLIHSLSGVPIAGWGVVWGSVALLLPLWALSRSGDQRGGPVWSAILINAVVGIVSVAIFAIASFRAGFWCITCLFTFAVVTVHGLVAYYEWRKHGGFQIDKRALGLVGGCTLVIYLILLTPGLRTPGAAAKEQMAALKTAHLQATPVSGEPANPKSAEDAQLVKFIASLSPQLQQALSDSIEVYRRAPEIPSPPPRRLHGPADAGIRITEFTDVLCSHCANLHQTLEELRRILPENTFALEMRQFPLDSACNQALDGPSSYPIRCFAAKAQICFETTGHAKELTSAIFANGRNLSEDVIFDLAKPYMSRGELGACINSADTAKLLSDDIKWAMAHDIEGTPLVLLDGREGTHFGPFLYAMALSHRNLDHPAFAKLPKPKRHVGHDH